MAHKWQRMALDALGQLNKLKKRAEVTLEGIRGFVSEHHQDELKDQPNWEQEVNEAVMELVEEKTVQQKADGSFGLPKKANWKRGKPKKKDGRSSALQRNGPIDKDGDGVEGAKEERVVEEEEEEQQEEDQTPRPKPKPKRAQAKGGKKLPPKPKGVDKRAREKRNVEAAMAVRLQ
jgi:hypothetical protein